MSTARLLPAALLLLLACGRPEAQDPHAPWSAEQLGGVFDLAELGGELAVEDGHLTLDGRPLPAEALARTRLTAGRSTNLLGLHHEALARMAPEVAYRLKHATPEQLREFQRRYRISPAMVQAARADDGWIDETEIRTLAASLDAHAAFSAAARTVPERAAAEGAGTALLRALGLTPEPDPRDHAPHNHVPRGSDARGGEKRDPDAR